MFPALHGREQALAHTPKITTFQKPHPLPTATYLNPYHFVLHFPPLSSTLLPSSTAGRPSHHRSNPGIPCFPQASLLCTISIPIGRYLATLDPGGGLSPTPASKSREHRKAEEFIQPSVTIHVYALGAIAQTIENE